MKDGFRNIALWVGAGLVVWRVDDVLAPVILGHTGLAYAGALPRLAALVCAAVIVWVLFGLVGIGAPARPPDLSALGRAADRILRHPTGRRALIVGGCGLTAVALVLALNLDGGSWRARWVKVGIDVADGAQPPPMLLRYGRTRSEASPVRWQPYAQTAVSIVPRSGDLVLTGATSEVGEVDLKSLTLSGALTRSGAGSGGDAIVVKSPGGILQWPAPARAIALTFLGGQAGGRVFWLDQQTTLEAGPSPQVVRLALPAKYQGWALLPPREVRTLVLESVDSGKPFAPALVEVETSPSQSWNLRGDASGWHANGCEVTDSQGHEVVRARLGTPCRIELNGVRVVNSRSLGGLVFHVLLLWGVLLLAAAAAPRVWRAATAMRWIEHERPIARSTGRLALIVWVVALTWHVAFALALPGRVVGDALDYLAKASAFMAQGDFSAFTDRTPGYPLLAAALMGTFGDNILAITLTNHVLLSLLAPLAVWMFASFLPLPVAVALGLLAGITPGLSVTAQFPLTESLSTAVMIGALFLVPAAVRSWRSGLIIGVLLGLGVLIRANNAVVLVLVLLWLVLRAAWQAAHRRLSAVLAAAPLAVVLGYVAAAGPWHAHLAFVRGMVDPSLGHAAFTLWNLSVYQKVPFAEQPLNAPDRALWAVPDAWRNDPFVLLTKYPGLYAWTIHPPEPYYQAVIDEARELVPSKVAEVEWATLRYNLCFCAPVVPLHYFPELEWTINYWKANSKEGETAHSRFDLMGQQWQPPPSLMRTWLLSVSQLSFDTWVWVAPFALILGGLTVLARGAPPWVGLVWSYVVVYLALSSFGLAPLDRYTMALEPLVDGIAVISCAVVVRWLIVGVRRVRAGFRPMATAA